MKQLSFFDDKPVNQIVNVASVPQRSPFRYPGGKTWLVPWIRQWLRGLPVKPHIFLEPFAGGGIVSLTVAFEDLCDKVLMVELDDEVAAVWKTILEGDGQWLADEVESFDLTRANVEKVLSCPGISLREKAFRTLLKNRVSHGGILAPGSGLMKYGENGKGISSRWYPKTIARRIHDLIRMRGKIYFIEGDGIETLKQNAQRADAVVFIDPPYTAGAKGAGRRLYKHYQLDHRELFHIAAALSGTFLMTYDNANEVRQLAQEHSFDTEVIPMQNTHLRKMTELLISRNLNWAR